MGFSRKRIGRDGKPRYTAYYLDIRGQERSAGTFPNKKDANDAWKKAEGTVSGGKPGDPSRGKQTFEAYALDKWLPHHQPEPGVRSTYARHIRHQAPAAPNSQLGAETAIESGMRWGELTETRTGDVDFETCILTVSRAVV